MGQVLALRPFVPAKDYELSKRFYQSIGCSMTHEDEHVTILEAEAFSFPLRRQTPATAGAAP